MGKLAPTDRWGSSAWLICQRCDRSSLGLTSTDAQNDEEVSVFLSRSPPVLIDKSHFLFSLFSSVSQDSNVTTVLDDYAARSSQELSVSKGQHVRVVQRQLPNAPDWCLIRLLNDHHHHHHPNQSSSSSIAASATTGSIDLPSPSATATKHIEGLVPAAILKATKSSASNSHPPLPPLSLPTGTGQRKDEEGEPRPASSILVLSLIGLVQRKARFFFLLIKSRITPFEKRSEREEFPDGDEDANKREVPATWLCTSSFRGFFDSSRRCSTSAAIFSFSI